MASSSSYDDPDDSDYDFLNAAAEAADAAQEARRNNGGAGGGAGNAMAGAPYFAAGAGGWGQEALLALHPGNWGGGGGYIGEYLQQLAAGWGAPGGALAGVIGATGGGGGGWGAAKVKAGKKYGVRMSHPRKVEEGFSRDIVNPPDDDDPVPVVTTTTKGRGKKKAKEPPVEMEPVCASCLDPLLLAQSGEKRPWALKCGHVVCGRCIGDAKMRCEEIKEAERKARWTEIGGKGKELVIDDDDEEEEEGEDDGELDYVDDVPTSTRSSRAGPTRRSNGNNSKGDSTRATPYAKPTTTTTTGKGKGKSRADETGVEELWTECPVTGCAGDGTDLLAKEGHWSGAFELFV